MTYRVFFLGLLLMHFTATGQFVNKGLITFSGAIGVLKPSTFSGDLNNHPFMINLKAGYFVKRGLTVGVEFQSTTYTNIEGGISALQQQGTTWTQAGSITDKFVSVGVFSDLHARINKRFFLISGVFAHYLHNSYVDKGEYYADSSPTGTTYTILKDKGYSFRTGANLTLCYFFKPDISLTLRCAEFDFRLRRKGNDAFIAAPLMLGIQYHFNL